MKNHEKGDIYMAGLDPVIGSEQGGRRPVIIVQNDLGNLHAPTVIAVPLTSSRGKPELPTHVRVPAGEAGLWMDSIALCEQVRTMEKSRLGRRIGMLGEERLAQVGRALRVSLDIDRKSEEE